MLYLKAFSLNAYRLSPITDRYSMQNFVFYNPTKIIFGRDTIPLIGSETKAWGERCLLVYGSGSIKANGIYDKVIASLNEAGIIIIEHGGVQSNPLLSHVREGIDKVKKNGVEVVVAVGEEVFWTVPRPSVQVLW